MKRDFLEEDMYALLAEHFTALGYKVNGEVHDCDVTAVKDDLLIILELKKALSMELLIQAVKRQKIGDLTYMAVPRPKKFALNRKFNETLYLLKRLSLGLIFVDVHNDSLEIILHPQEFDMGKSKRLNQVKKDRLLQEISQRQTSLNKGGSRGKKLMTAYREDSLKVLYLAGQAEFLQPKTAVRAGISKAPSILRDNYYHWFMKLDRGKYTLTETGRQALEEHGELIRSLVVSLLQPTAEGQDQVVE